MEHLIALIMATPMHRHPTQVVIQQWENMVNGLSRRRESLSTSSLIAGWKQGMGLTSSKLSGLKLPPICPHYILTLCSMPLSALVNGEGYIIFIFIIPITNHHTTAQRKVYHHRLKGISGLGNRWLDAKGMDIDIQMKDQWGTIVQVSLILMH